MSSATYGQLMDAAAASIAAGVVDVERNVLHVSERAWVVVGAWQALLQALERHLWAVLDPRRVPGIELVAGEDGRDWAAVRLLRALDPVVSLHRTLPVPRSGSREPWALARRYVRAATDLLATHRDLEGAPRSPDADAISGDPVARSAALARVGEMVAVVVGVEEQLALRALQAGCEVGRVEYALRKHPSVGRAAWQLAGMDAPPATARSVGLTVARPEPWGDSEAAEVANRVLRLRQAAWALPQAEFPSVEAVKSFVLLGAAVHAHAAALSDTDAARARLSERGRAWSAVGREVFTWRTPTPVDPQVGEEAREVVALLRRVAPLSGPAPQRTRVEQTQLREALAGAVEMTAQIAGWSAEALRLMGAAGRVYQPARRLTGDQVTENLALVQAKLTGGTVPVRMGVFADVVAALDALSTPTRASAATSSRVPGLGAAPFPPTPEPETVEPISRSGS